MNKIVIYPGRFQPMLRHHVEVYDYLVKTFSDAEVFIGTSDKVTDTSPFNFKEKQMIAMAQGIDPNKVLFAPQPYVHTFYKQFDHDNTIVIFAVGEKDMAERFAMNNVDPSTGLDMKVKEPEPKYYQMINSMKDTPLPMSKRGYLFEVPNIDIDGEVASATAFRNQIKSSPDKEAAKSVFDKQFREYNEEVFNLVYNKIVGKPMSENIQILRQLAGLNVEEGAPVEFEDHVEVKDIEFTPPSKSSSFHSIANRFPEGSDVNDMDTKREEFVNALIKSPASLLSEINERISPADDNGLAASEKLNKIINIVQKDGASLSDLDDDNKKFTMELVKKAIKEMDLDAGDDTEYDPEEEPKEESVDLTSIREDYGIVELDESIIVADIFEDFSEPDFDEFIESLSVEELKILESTYLMEVGVMQRMGRMFGGGNKQGGNVNVYDKRDQLNKQGGGAVNMMKKGVKGTASLLGKLGKIGGNVAKKILDKGKQIAGDINYRLSPEGKHAANQAKIEKLNQLRVAKANQAISAQDLKNTQLRIAQDTNPDVAQATFDKMMKTDPERAGQFIANFEVMGSIDAALQRIELPDYKVDGAFDKPAQTSKPGRYNEPENIFNSADLEEGRLKDILIDLEQMSKEEFEDEYPNEDYDELYKNYMMDDPNEPSQEEIDANYEIVKKYIAKGSKKEESMYERSEDSGEPSIRDMSDEDLMDYVGQKEEDLIDDMQQYLAPDFLHKDNFEEMFDKYREEVLEPAAHEISQDHAADNMMGAEESVQDMKKDEVINDTTDKALEAAMSELRKLAGLNEAEKKDFDESGCMKEMKKLYASGCAKESMYQKLNAEYNCSRKQFEELYAHACG